MAQEKLNTAEAPRTQQPSKAISLNEIIECALEAATGYPTSKASTHAETKRSFGPSKNGDPPG